MVERGRGVRRASRWPVIALHGLSKFARGCPDCNRVISESRALGDRPFYPELVAGRCCPSVVYRRPRRRLQSIGQAMRACWDWAGRGRGVEALEWGEEGGGLGEAAQARGTGMGSASVAREEAMRDLVKTAGPRWRAFGTVLDNGL